MSDELPRIPVNATAQIEKQKSPPPNGLKVEPIPAKYLKFLSKKAQKMLAIEVQSLKVDRIITYPNGYEHKEPNEVVYFAATAPNAGDISKAVSKIVELLNEAADRGFITGALMNVSSIELIDNKVCVFCYPLMTMTGVAFYKDNRYSISAGEIPKEIE